MLSAVIDSIKSLLEVVASRMIAAILLTGLLIVLGLTYTLHTNFVSILERFPSTQVEQDRFVRQLEINSSIQPELDRVAETIGAERVTISQFSNGVTDLSGIPFLFFRLTHAHVELGVSLGPEYGQPVPLSVYSDLFSAIWKDRANPICIQLDTNQITSVIGRARLEARGTGRIAVCPLTDVRGSAVGMVMSEWLVSATRNNRSTDNVPVLSVLSQSANRLSAMLSSVIRR